MLSAPRSREDVDAAGLTRCARSAAISIACPVEGDFAPGYYFFVFEDPDGIRLEVNFIPGKGLLVSPDNPLIPAAPIRTGIKTPGIKRSDIKTNPPPRHGQPVMAGLEPAISINTMLKAMARSAEPPHPNLTIMPIGQLISRWIGGAETMQADYVIVGAGSAGCVLANRLTEDPNTNVILIEAGGRDHNPLIHIPAGFFKMLDHDKLTWKYRSEPDPGTNGRAIVYTRGKVIGGSSSINGLIYIRGQPEDYDHWAQLGNRGWSWDDCLPFFRAAENWEGESNAVRGKDGPLFTSKMDRSPICATVIEAGKQLGLEYREDVNDLQPGDGDGIGWCQQTRGGRRRASAARTYLHPALKRPNLQLVTHALVHRVLFEGKRATGIEFSRGGAIETINATREVILSAGAVGSPHILQLSGVGDPEHLGSIGVDLVHELRGVGRNMQDHYTARISCPVVGIWRQRRRKVTRHPARDGSHALGFNRPRHVELQPLTRRAASVKVLETSATPDMQVTFAPGSFKGGQIGELEETPGLSASPWQMRPQSRGYVEARSNQTRRHARDQSSLSCPTKPTSERSSAAYVSPAECSTHCR